MAADNTLRLFAGDIFGTSRFAGAGAFAQPTNPVNDMPDSSTAVTPTQPAALAPVGQPFNPLWWLGIVVILFAFMFVVNKYGKGESFGNIKLTAYNAVVMSWLPIVGILFWKMVFSRIRVPIVSDVVMSV